jgi:hypothetical protein
LVSNLNFNIFYPHPPMEECPPLFHLANIAWVF